MTIETQTVPEANGLDAIEVIWQDYEPGKGRATFICYGTAWTAYFGGMGDRTIKQFISQCGADYLGPKFWMNEINWITSLKCRDAYEKYLERVINAVKKEIQ